MKQKTFYLSRKTLNKFKEFESLRTQVLSFIYSKTNDLEISNRGIELKTEIEKVREQIQNIE